MSDDLTLPDAASVPRRALDARIRNFRGTVMVARGDAAFELSETAGVVWRGIDETRTAGDLAQLLCAEYDVDYDTAFEDVSELLAGLARAGIVTY